MTTIAHISDLHVGAPYFSPELAENVVGYLDRLEPDIVVVTGDITDYGYIHEYEKAVELLSRINTRDLILVPGNHDSRNMGYVVFEELFGTRYPFLRSGSVCIQGVDSSEPDLDDGHIGRLAYRLVEENLGGCNGVRIVALHHHLVPVPGTGRERNIPADAGDFLDLLMRLGVNIVLAGHKHVPWIWELNGMLLVHAGTATTTRIKAGTVPSFNVLRVEEGGEVEVVRVNSYTLRETPVYRGTPRPFPRYSIEQYREMLDPVLEKARGKLHRFGRVNGS
ncbi:metallophosphoesterase family protein [Pyrodictium occultum]|uniref:metallophosphoesterase family protein n=1 Tax=Pyrodictium occultum TaxID=2309 RepID=UPI0008AA4F95|nr:metallophosphoesterase family protein [Pyrodictium occultum]